MQKSQTSIITVVTQETQLTVPRVPIDYNKNKNNQKIPLKPPFSKYSIQITGTPNLWEEALCYMEVQSLLENSLWFGKCLPMPN